MVSDVVLPSFVKAMNDFDCGKTCLHGEGQFNSVSKDQTMERHQIMNDGHQC